MPIDRIIFVIVLVVVAFVILRELICWYFKINERITMQQKILEELIKLNSINH